MNPVDIMVIAMVLLALSLVGIFILPIVGLLFAFAGAVIAH